MPESPEAASSILLVSVPEGKKVNCWSSLLGVGMVGRQSTLSSRKRLEYVLMGLGLWKLRTISLWWRRCSLEGALSRKSGRGERSAIVRSETSLRRDNLRSGTDMELICWRRTLLARFAAGAIGLEPLAAPKPSVSGTEPEVIVWRAS